MAWSLSLLGNTQAIYNMLDASALLRFVVIACALNLKFQSQSKPLPDSEELLFFPKYKLNLNALPALWGLGSAQCVLMSFSLQCFCSLFHSKGWISLKVGLLMELLHTNLVLQRYTGVPVFQMEQMCNLVSWWLWKWGNWQMKTGNILFFLTGKTEVPRTSHWKIREHASSFHWNAKGRKSWKSYCKSLKVTSSWDTSTGECDSVCIICKLNVKKVYFSVLDERLGIISLTIGLITVDMCLWLWRTWDCFNQLRKKALKCLDLTSTETGLTVLWNEPKLTYEKARGNSESFPSRWHTQWLMFIYWFCPELCKREFNFVTSVSEQRSS